MKDKVCVVTGGARGIGRGIAETFAREGATCVYALDMNDSEFAALAKAYPAIKGVVVNVTDGAAVEAFVQRAVAEHGRIDVLVNNAGITKDALVQKMTEEMWDAVINVNLKGVFLMTKYVAPVMMEKGAGSIVSISSVVGLDGNIGQSNYAATKGGVVAMTKGWAREFARKGAKVRVNCVSPGYTRTPMIETVPEKVLEPIIARTPLGRLAEIQDIANGVLFLSCDESAFVTGQVLRVDGGLVL
ncbi:MAG: beta-ketoacyl-ACP reductase [Spirochaetes bacterium GWD1_61_31]|nr:MAG: beta-ketoacyl-ACP reductase [Spirochaetes bacterium GWB1_60_80]OHD33602.1 MAG: beta-ketoacyl-ACP reductase [Spirochaetes bacterium GWC1_61_12]OHD38525.1 MAG: beta-ketoacyl-ACP reductase [Spirochaetes bacterium GWD1_61_31]OHD43043.1 MAG: beta-ketoacyl-ACP reductase [Spirochaetes bacterium GWE1_60_18]OHD59638.1 MAG: beta-ketoacyl-ACP reductase [Spirochaetes bacterium GWF1_60_12]HAP44140.1 beta-ketoacyl-ACP reductase [Spirochaetaceae bacterium]